MENIPSSNSATEPKVASPVPDYIPLSTAQIYELTEIKILQNIEDKFLVRLQRKFKIWGVVAVVATVVFGIFGIGSFWSQLRSYVETAAKAEVDQRIASEFPRLESRIDETFKSGILAKDASEKSIQKLNDFDQRFVFVETGLTNLNAQTFDAKTNVQILTATIIQQSNDLVHLETILKGWFKNSKSDTFNFSDTNSFLVCAALPDGSKTLVAFLLSSVPVEGSLRLQYHVYAQPPGSYWNIENVVFFVWGESLSNLGAHQVFASYVSDPTATNIFHKITVQNGKLVGDGRVIFDAANVRLK